MDITKLKEKYPEVWKRVYRRVYEDEKYNADIIAYNAAVYACVEIEKEGCKKKQKSCKKLESRGL